MKTSSTVATVLAIATSVSAQQWKFEYGSKTQSGNGARQCQQEGVNYGDKFKLTIMGEAGRLVGRVVLDTNIAACSVKAKPSQEWKSITEQCNREKDANAKKACRAAIEKRKKDEAASVADCVKNREQECWRRQDSKARQDCFEQLNREKGPKQTGRPPPQQQPPPPPQQQQPPNNPGSQPRSWAQPPQQQPPPPPQQQPPPNNPGSQPRSWAQPPPPKAAGNPPPRPQTPQPPPSGWASQQPPSSGWASPSRPPPASKQPAASPYAPPYQPGPPVPFQPPPPQAYQPAVPIPAPAPAPPPPPPQPPAPKRVQCCLKMYQDKGCKAAVFEACGTGEAYAQVDVGSWDIACKQD